ncbi:MAG: pseudouridylate synthase [Myxococcales bacterium]|nr:pseudouridylate synthase [Myxococcales bacterium]
MNAPQALRVLHEDEALVIVDKPSGVVVHPGWAQDDGGVLAQVEAHIGQKLHPLHRLDRGTSGVLLFARHAEAARVLGAAFAEGRVAKCYLALVRGHPPAQVLVDHPVPKTEGGERVPARTEVQCLGTWQRYALVKALPHTGRFHQVRRHLKHLSCPLIGDANYGKSAHNRYFKEAFGLDRLALHALALRFVHPLSGVTLQIVAPPTGGLQNCFEALGFGSEVAKAAQAPFG